MFPTYEQTLREIVVQDDRYVVMTAENRAVIRGLAEQLGPRFVDTGITEQTMVGMAAGLALRGRVPVVHALAAFLTMRPFEFIRTDVGLGRLPVKLVGGVPGFLSDGNGPTHQALEDVALMRGIPGMGIFCPADRQELIQGLPHVLADPRPFYIRYVDRQPAVAHLHPFAIGRAEQLKKGVEIMFLTYGFLLAEVLEARHILELEGISAGVLNMRTLSPLDEGAVLRAAVDAELLVTVEDHFLAGGLFTLVAELLTRERLNARVYPIALEQRWFRPGRLEEVLRHEGFTGPQIADRVLEIF